MFNSRSAIVIAMFAASASVALAEGPGYRGRHDHTARLYDARGRLVGTVVDASMQSSSSDFVSDGGVIMDVKGAPVFVGFSRRQKADGVRSANAWIWSANRPAYSSPRCTGTPYIAFTLGPLRPAAIERKGGKAVLYVAKDQPEQYENVGSQAHPDGCEDFFAGPARPVWLIGDSINLSDEYPEPLTIGP
ncbi:hypothetical protein [Caballeronia sp. SL2Y3]|uniref:hypothetical protein n=1 Tax=Caballeronia sp. SL2Y3 TaxID=2878151 RepID=UPI001FD177BB|nr:hypothetical protein [Caballeronia sp. SL2Y3]